MSRFWLKKQTFTWIFISKPRPSPVVPGVPDGALPAQPVALLQVEGVLPVRVVPRLQLLGGQVDLLIEAPQQLALLGSGGLAHLSVQTWTGSEPACL